MKLISNKALREFSLRYRDAHAPLQSWRLIEHGTFLTFSELRATFASVGKVGDKFVFNISGNNYRLIATIAFTSQIIWVKAVLTHTDYSKGTWK